ncbi:hypothetical protein ABT026_02215 [Streptomyces sp. NPDC002734]|uniref:hypothetical protein n=1 Tax=Streptomyces sp. NPDC002734 TaxID=3154426 RepID=UPI00331D0D31
MALNDPTDDEVRARLCAHVARSGRGRRPAPAPTDFDLSPSHLVELTVTRRTERRTETTRHLPGAVDLASRPTYDVLADHKLGPHETPLHRPLDLVRRGTVHRGACGCGNGRRTCPDCDGKRYRSCDPAQVCPMCQGVSACTQHLKHGGLADAPTGRLRPGRTGTVEQRVTCEGCHTPAAACPGCRGWGKVRCKDCDTKGRIPCKPCGHRGTVGCTACEGNGNVTTWTAGRIAWDPETEEPSPPTPRPRRIAAELDGAGWREDVLDDDAPLPDDLSPEHRDFLERHLGRRPDERGRHVVVRRLKVVRAQLRGVGHREFYAFLSPDGDVRVVGRLSEEGRFRFAVGGAVVVAVAVLALLLLR